MAKPSEKAKPPENGRFSGGLGRADEIGAG